MTKTLTLETLNEKCPVIRDGYRWGNWVFNENDLTLNYKLNRPGSRACYEIDLERMDSASEVVDWLAQVSTKAWCSPEDVGQLLLALNTIFNLQANLVHGEGFVARKYLRERIGKLRDYREL